MNKRNLLKKVVPNDVPEVQWNCGEEKPRVYDIRDGLVNMLRYSGFARDRSYKKYNWE